MIAFNFTITESEYLEAQQLFIANLGRKSQWRRTTVWFIFIAGLALALWTSPRPLQISTFPPYVPILFVLCFYPIFSAPLQRRSLKKRFVAEKQNLVDATMQLDDAGLHVSVPNRGSGVALWPSFSKWIEGNLVIILPNGLQMRIIPKRTLTGPQLIELRELLSKQLGPVGIATAKAPATAEASHSLNPGP